MEINRLLSDDHLLEAFEALRHRTTGAALFVARRIEQDCFLDARAQFTVSAVLAGRTIQRFARTPVAAHESWDGSVTVVQVRPTRVQVDAARELFRRCEGFATRTAEMHRTDGPALEDSRTRFVAVITLGDYAIWGL